MNQNKKKKTKLILSIIVLITLLIIIFYFYSVYNQKEYAKVTFVSNQNQLLEINCEIADSPSEIITGLMYREELKTNEGMIFIYQHPQMVSYWMKNVYIPLDIIFIDENQHIINVEEANVVKDAVDDLEYPRYYSQGAVKYVVEINQGLSKKYNITNNTKVNIENI